MVKTMVSGVDFPLNQSTGSTERWPLRSIDYNICFFSLHLFDLHVNFKMNFHLIWPLRSIWPFKNHRKSIDFFSHVFFTCFDVPKAIDLHAVFPERCTAWFPGWASTNGARAKLRRLRPGDFEWISTEKQRRFHCSKFGSQAWFSPWKMRIQWLTPGVFHVFHGSDGHIMFPTAPVRKGMATLFQWFQELEKCHHLTSPNSTPKISSSTWITCGYGSKLETPRNRWLILTAWWFGSFLFFHIGNNDPNWRAQIFQRGRYTTNQLKIA